MNRTPNTTATAMPRTVPVKLMISVELSETAERMRTVSTPSRRTSRKTKKKRPSLGGGGAGEAGDLGFDFALHRSRGLVHEPDHADHKGRGGEHDPAFDDVGVEVQVGNEDGGEDAGDEGGAEAPKDGSFELVAADLREVGEDNADDERGFDAFAEGDD